MKWECRQSMIIILLNENNIQRDLCQCFHLLYTNRPLRMLILICVLISLKFSFFFSPYISYTLFSLRSYYITICSTFSKIILLISAQGKEVRDIVCLKFMYKSWIMIFEGFFLSMNHQGFSLGICQSQNYFYIGCSFRSKLKWKYFPIRMN